MSTQALVCLHCGTAFTSPHALDAKNAFCCAGCKFVHTVIRGKGLSEFYDIKSNETRIKGSEAAPLKPVEESWLKRDWSSLDHPETMTHISPDGVKIQFHVDDLSCTACVWILERLEIASDQILWSKLDMGKSLLTVARKDHGRFSDIAKTITELGFRCDPVSGKSDWRTRQSRALKRDLVRTGVLGALTGNIMLLSVSLYGGADGRLGSVFEWTMGALALPIVTWGALPIYRNTLRALKQRKISIDLPISLAVLAGAVIGYIGLFQSYDTLFFDSVAMLVFLLQASRTSLNFIRSRMETLDEVPVWLLDPVIDAESGAPIVADQIQKEQTFVLRQGQRLPVDARIESTGTLWDLSVTNGESEPQTLLAQSALPAGARLLSEKATLRAEGLVTESRVARLVSEWRGSRDTAEAEVDFHLSRATKQESLRTLADRVGEVFTLVVIAIAAVLLFIPFETGPAGWLRALALLVVTCPCIFGFAIPLAETMAVNKAARSGLVVRDPSFFQRLQRVKKTFLDKTGTLTTGRMVYLGFKIVDYHQTNRQSQSIDHHVSELLSLAYAIEQNDPHPIARAICDTAQARGLSPSPLIMSSQRLPEGGRTAIGKGGAYLIRTRAQTSDSGRIEVELSLNGDVLGLFFFKDEIRPYALALVQFLSARGHDLSILSGDHPLPLQRIAQRIAPDSAQASIQTYANMTARQKAETIRQQGEASAVMMIGDGVNDADALKAADVSIAVRGDFATCLESADAVLVSHDLQPIVEALLISDRLKKALRLSLTFSATFNVIAATLAITGHMSPMIAAILMPLSSLSVSGISWTILRQEPRKRPVAAAKVEGAKA